MSRNMKIDAKVVLARVLQEGHEGLLTRGEAAALIASRTRDARDSERTARNRAGMVLDRACERGSVLHHGGLPRQADGRFRVNDVAYLGAVASMKLRHVDLIEQSVFQDARDVKTKNSKTFTTTFFPVGEEIRTIVVDWITWLRAEKLWGLDDPLFPATRCQQDGSNQFQAADLSPTGWQSAGPIRRIFREAFTQAGLPYFNPHSLRKTLTLFGQQRCTLPEQYKAWSQNLGHEGVLTTFISYGTISAGRQSEIMRQLASPKIDKPLDPAKTLAANIRQLLDTVGA